MIVSAVWSKFSVVLQLAFVSWPQGALHTQAHLVLQLQCVQSLTRFFLRSRDQL